jgi:predicted molibdopterin-dependent oxidoreductase YjgC
MNMVNLKINDKKLSVPAGTTILEAARKSGIYIPTLCDDPRLEPAGACRLCLVQVDGLSKPVTGCTTPVKEGMDVVTSNPEIERQRRTIIELLLSDHPYDCMVCEKAGDCTLQELAYYYDVKPGKFEGERRDLSIRDDNPFIVFDPNKCIVCGRCTRICNDVVMAGTIDLTGRGFKAIPDTAFGNPRSLKNCEFCGQCVSACPSGALTDRKGSGKGRMLYVKRVKTTCSYCGTGCNFYLNVKGNKVISVTSAYDAPVNKGNLCIKGRYGYDFIHSPERIRTPLIRTNGHFEEATWDEALALVATRFRELIDKYGPEKVGGFSSSRCTNEENYLLSKWVRCAVGSNNVDNCARV